MNSIGRCRKAIRWVAPDRVPVVPLILSHAAALAGVLILLRRIRRRRPW